MLIYNILFNKFGPQNWWPAETKLEVIIGAILTQAVSWRNVEKAVENMKKEGCINIAALKNIDKNRLAGLIKPSGYYNMKAKKIKEFIKFLSENYKDNLQQMFKTE